MENNINVNELNMRGQGSNEHIQFTLVVDEFALEGRGLLDQSRFAFFNLKQAIMALLKTDLSRLDPVVATHARHAYCQRVAVHYDFHGRYHSGSRKMAELLYIRHGHEIYDVSEPGIYLHVPMGIERLQDITSIPLLPSSELEEKNVVQLAHYNKSFETIRLLPGFENALRYIQGQQERQAISGDRMGFDLVYKQEESHEFGAERPAIIHCHCYDNLQEPLEALASVDPTHFDPYSARNRAGNGLLQYGYLMAPDQWWPVAAISVVDIAAAPYGSPGAGVYLQMVPEIGTVGKQAMLHFGIDDLTGQNVPLAAYKYDNGISLQPSLNIEMLKVRWAQNRAATGENSHSPFITTLLYDIPVSDVRTGNLPRQAGDHFHYSLLSLALLRLLDADVSLFNDYNANDSQFAKLRAAFITDDKGKQWARIHPTAMDQAGKTTVQLELTQPLLAFALEAGVVLDMAGLSSGENAAIQTASGLAIPLAHIEMNGSTQLVKGNYTLLEQLFKAEIFAKDLPVTRRITQAMAADPPPVDPAFFIRLDWQTGAPGRATTAEVLNLVSTDLETAFAYLINMNAQLFGGGQHPTVYVEAATLYDQHSQAVATRFAVGQDHLLLEPGFYLYCERHHPDIDLITHLCSNEQLVDAAEKEYALYRQRLLGNPPTSMRARVLAPWKDHSGRSIGH